MLALSSPVRLFALATLCWMLAACSAAGASAVPGSSPNGDEASIPVTLLFTNDFESTYHPTVAFWRDDIRRIGGVAQLAALINHYREREANVFLFDSGDIFTGTLAKRTRGALAFELMITMGYDAMAVGNHEFEYGWQEFAQQKQRVPFPVLATNLYYAGTDIRYTQPYAIIERDGIRVAAIGVLGQDAATALIPSNIAGVDVRDPVPEVRALVEQLRGDVDLIVLLTHQGHTAPMQTDDEAQPDIQRDIAADLALAGAVEGIDVLLGGHADAGTREPVVHPDSGTLIMQTYGQGFHLGYLQLQLDARSRKVIGYDGRLVSVDSDALPADPAVAAKLRRYEAQQPDLYEPVGHLAARLNRYYNVESDLGNLFADIVRSRTQADIGLMPSGALRKDLPAGEVALIDVLDVFPFEDRIATLEMSGAVLRAVLEQGLSLQRGILQVSGMEVRYDPGRPSGKRIVSVTVAGQPLAADMTYRVGTVEILAKGGDAYVQARQATRTELGQTTFAAALTDYFRATDLVTTPANGRLIAVPSSR